MADRKVGVWFLGALGGVATTATLGIVALRKGLIGNQGLVSQLPLFAELGLVDWDELVIGGHDIRQSTLFDEALKLANISRAIDRQLVERRRLLPFDLDRAARAVPQAGAEAVAEPIGDEPRFAADDLQGALVTRRNA